jgi:uncharacterized iron-regulated membrane protein
MAIKSIYKWHHWTGLVAGLFLLLMSITGSILVFTDEMEHTADQPLKEFSNPSGSYSYDSSFAMIKQKFPGYEVRLYDRPGKNEALVYELRGRSDSKKVFVNPTRPEIIKTIDGETQLHRKLLLFHYTFFVGTTGKIFVVVIGILFLLSVITGFIIFHKAIWKTIRFKTVFRYRGKAAFYSSLHCNIGVWTLIFNLLIITSGLALSITIAKNAIKTSDSKPSTSHQVDFSLDSVVERVTRSNPEFEIHLVRIPVYGNTVRISGRYKNDPAIYGDYASYYLINGLSKKTEKKQVMSDLPLTEKLLLMAAPLHFGNYGGIFLKILYCFLGIMPAILSITGFLIWRKRSRVRM